MSDYLVQRIESSPKITLHPFSEITALAGDTILREVTWIHRKTGAHQTRRIGAVSVMIGAEPNTQWLDSCPRSMRKASSLWAAMKKGARA